MSDEQLDELIEALSSVRAGNGSDGPAMSNAAWLYSLAEAARHAGPDERPDCLAEMKSAKPVLLRHVDAFEPGDRVEPEVLARAARLWRKAVSR